MKFSTKLSLALAASSVIFPMAAHAASVKDSVTAVVHELSETGETSTNANYAPSTSGITSIEYLAKRYSEKYANGVQDCGTGKEENLYRGTGKQPR